MYMCSEDFTMTDCEAYGKHTFKPQPWDRAHSETEYETIATTDRVYDTVNIPINHETGYEAITTTITGYKSVTTTDTGYEGITTTNTGYKAVTTTNIDKAVTTTDTMYEATTRM